VSVAIYNKLQNYWQHIDEISHVAAFLDPCYKIFSRLTQNSSDIQQIDEIQRYWNLLLYNDDIEPLTWWKMHQDEFPLLSNLAQNYLAIQASSVSCEQLFPIAGAIISKARNRLTSENARACLCLKSWIDKNILGPEFE
ncbi:1491_t:CDS:2, partial [Dentiscutata heterogama]